MQPFRLANNAGVPLIDIDFNGYTSANAATRGANYRVDLRTGQPVHQWWTRPAGAPLPAGLEYSRMVILENGYVGIGTVSPAAQLDVNGNINVAGNINAKYQDLAEWVPADTELAAGTVVVLDPSDGTQVMSSRIAYDTSVAGVVSAQPGIVLGEGAPDKLKIATTGRVRVRVDATSAPIRVGDLLVTSDKPGQAMRSVPLEIGGRAFHQPGTIVGKALEPLASGEGEILVLLSLQ